MSPPANVSAEEKKKQRRDCIWGFRVWGTRSREGKKGNEVSKELSGGLASRRELSPSEPEKKKLS